MQPSLIAALGAVAALATSTGASAAGIEFKDAVARVTVIPEARSDVAVSIVKNDAHHPLQVSTGLDGRTIVDGGYRNGLFGGISSCNSVGGHPFVHVRGVGVIGWDDMAQVVVRVPLDAHVAGGGAVSGPSAAPAASICRWRDAATGPWPTSVAGSPCPTPARAMCTRAPPA